MHTTEFSSDGGCFTLCESCWSELTIKERLPYYDHLVTRWIGMDLHENCGRRQEELETRWTLIRQAVLAGK